VFARRAREFCEDEVGKLETDTDVYAYQNRENQNDTTCASQKRRFQRGKAKRRDNHLPLVCQGGRNIVKRREECKEPCLGILQSFYSSKWVSES
jgi:hypothetical protein